MSLKLAKQKILNAEPVLRRTNVKEGGTIR